MMNAYVTEDQLRRVYETERLANARADTERKLRCAGYAMSDQQQAVLDILDETRGQHPSVRDILDELRKQYPRASKDLPYRLLYALEGFGLIRFRRLAGKVLGKRIDVRVDLHLDILCKRCGAVEEIEVVASGEAGLAEVRRGVCQVCAVGSSAGEKAAA